MKQIARAALVVLALGTTATAATSQNPAGAAAQPPRAAAPASPQEILLWENGAPGALGQADNDKPTMTVYRAARVAVRARAVIVAPGGGYGALAMEHEGRQEA